MDEKRRLREEKRAAKRAGNRRLRRRLARELDRDPEDAHLSDPRVDPADSTAGMNRPPVAPPEADAKMGGGGDPCPESSSLTTTPTS